MRAEIRVEWPAYSLRDTARLRISLTNTSERAVGYIPMGPSDMIRLVVTRDGRPLERNVSEARTAGFQLMMAGWHRGRAGTWGEGGGSPSPTSATN